MMASKIESPLSQTLFSPLWDQVFPIGQGADEAKSQDTDGHSHEADSAKAGSSSAWTHGRARSKSAHHLTRIEHKSEWASVIVAQ